MSVSEPRVCSECGSDTYFAQNFAEMRDKLQDLREDYKRQAAKHAVEKAQWRLDELDREGRYRFLQGKAHRQRLVINRLEAKLRRLGVTPHAPDPTGEDTPGG